MGSALTGAAGYRAARRAQGRRIRGLLFDKDGTLFDFHRTWSGWTRDLVERLAEGDPDRAERLADSLEFDLAAGRFLKSSPVIAGTVEVVVSAILRVMPDASPDALRAMLIREAAALRPVEAAPLRPLLDALRGGGYALGVATNDAEAAARSQLADAGVLNRFAFVAGYDSGFGAKPGIGMLIAFCDALELPPEDVAMIGDSTHDLHPARAAGMAAIAVLTGPADAPDLAPHADAVLPDIAALPGWLAGEQ
jgi:phosphoglycolate phosphatase